VVPTSIVPLSVEFQFVRTPRRQNAAGRGSPPLLFFLKYPRWSGNHAVSRMGGSFQSAPTCAVDRRGDHRRGDQRAPLGRILLLSI